MSKGIIVLNIPKQCKDCVAFRENEDYGSYCLKSMKFLTDAEERPEWCEIHKLPEYKPEVITYGSACITSESIECSVRSEGRIIKENIGYNECLDDILGGIKNEQSRNRNPG